MADNVASHPGRALAAAILAGVVFLGLHVPFLAWAPDDIDATNFMLALRHFDLREHQPHPPGYPVFIAMAHVARAGITAIAPLTGPFSPAGRLVASRRFDSAVDWQVPIPSEVVEEAGGDLTLISEAAFVPDRRRRYGDQRELALRVRDLGVEFGDAGGAAGISAPHRVRERSTVKRRWYRGSAGRSAPAGLGPAWGIMGIVTHVTATKDRGSLEASPDCAAIPHSIAGAASADPRRGCPAAVRERANTDGPILRARRTNMVA